MKTFGWTLLIIIFIIMAMILVTIVSQTGLLQTRVQHGIGSQVDSEQPAPY